MDQIPRAHQISCQPHPESDAMENSPRANVRQALTHVFAAFNALSAEPWTLRLPP